MPISLSLVALFLSAVVQAPADLPFAVDASEDAASQFPAAPRLQSFSFGQWKGRWVFIGGRIAGYHSVGGGSADFLRIDANRDIWVVDTTVQPAKTFHVPVDQLASDFAPIKDQWTSTGQLYFQDKDQLYICGGYGQDHAGNWVTFPVISRVDLPKVIDEVMRGQLSGKGIAFGQSPLTQSTGGGLIKLRDGYFYLVMGHNFQGSYTAFEGQGEHNAAEAASQTYLNEIRKLKITSAGDRSLHVSLAEKFEDVAEFHRRDLNVTPILAPNGLGLAVYGGVFTPETQLAYDKPIYLFDNAKPVVDSSFQQKMNAYACPRLLIYDQAGETMYTTLFGGISQYFWNATARTFIENPRVGAKVETRYLDGLQWSDQISTIQKVMATGKEKTREAVHAALLPAFVGTGAVFIPAPEMAGAELEADILDLESLRGTRTLVGYIYGGIRAFPYQFPYNKTAAPYRAGTVPTRASELILKVYVEAKRR